MNKSVGNVPEFDDFDEPDEAERRQRIHRPRKSSKRKRPVRGPTRRGWDRALLCG
jgi:hypothetical protein